MKIAIGADHGGFSHKEVIFKHLKDLGFDVVDFGTYDTKAVDYNDFAMKVSEGVSRGEFDRGILICGTGIGISISANKVKDVRAALVYDELTGRLAKEHNNANIIALGGRTTSYEQATKIIDSLSDPRHVNI